MIAFRQLHFVTDFVDSLTDGAAEITSAHAVFDGNVTLVAFAIDRGGAVVKCDLAELSQRDALSGRSEEADLRDVFDRAAVGGLIADGHVEALLADEYLAYRLASNGGFDRVLDIANVDAEAVGGGAIYIEIDIGLAANLEGPEVGNADDLAHYALNLVGLFFESLQVAAEQLHRQLTFYTTNGFFD